MNDDGRKEPVLDVTEESRSFSQFDVPVYVAGLFRYFYLVVVDAL